MRRRLRRAGVIELTGRQWTAASAFAATAVWVAVGVGPPPRAPVMSPDRVAAARAALRTVDVIPRRPPHDAAYSRAAFGVAWTDAADVRGSGNGCDTRNDILARDVEVSGRTPVASCPRAVASGVLASPYSGRPVVFERGRSSSAVQIDHIVPLAFAWDMGAHRWSSELRTAFANDPSNLVAVDGASNQAKSDAEPARWMPPLRAFHCQYAIQFAIVLHRYALPVDAPSHRVLVEALARC